MAQCIVRWDEGVSFLAGMAAALLLTLSTSGYAQERTADGPQYADGDGLVFPDDYRSWPFIGAGVGMSYGEEGGTPRDPENPVFSHVFVNPSAYRFFIDTGTWPDGTVFMLEFRDSSSEGAIIDGGSFATSLRLVEANVKDSRFEDGWAFYVFGPGNNIAPVVQPLKDEAAAPCVECHSEHAAVERTFVQFYPTLLEVAREKGTLNSGYTED